MMMGKRRVQSNNVKKFLPLALGLQRVDGYLGKGSLVPSLDLFLLGRLHLLLVLLPLCPGGVSVGVLGGEVGAHGAIGHHLGKSSSFALGNGLPTIVAGNFRLIA